MKPETPSISVSATTNNARHCAATVETIKIPSPEATCRILPGGVLNLVNGGSWGGQRRACAVPPIHRRALPAMVGTLRFAHPTKLRSPRGLQRLRGIDIEKR